MSKKVSVYMKRGFLSQSQKVCTHTCIFAHKTLKVFQLQTVLNAHRCTGYEQGSHIDC